jgi:hypothetical protein
LGPVELVGEREHLVVLCMVVVSSSRLAAYSAVSCSRCGVEDVWKIGIALSKWL